MRINRVTSKKNHTFRRARSNTMSSTKSNSNNFSENNDTHACYISEDKKCVCYNIFKFLCNLNKF